MTLGQELSNVTNDPLGGLASPHCTKAFCPRRGSGDGDYMVSHCRGHGEPREDIMIYILHWVCAWHCGGLEAVSQTVPLRSLAASQGKETFRPLGAPWAVTK